MLTMPPAPAPSALMACFELARDARAPASRAIARKAFARMVMAFAAALCFASGAPRAAHAQPSGPLPSGYASDEGQPAASGGSRLNADARPATDADDDLAQDAADADVDAEDAGEAVAGDEHGEYADTDPSALTDFRQPLEPYGTWIQDPTYGVVWVPNAGPDFAPYQTEGHWALTEEGDWYWVSYYPWGYIPFHYGRWVWISGQGWAWIPGRMYAPAWVVWRVGDAGYIGWAPMPPTYYWVGGVAVGLWVVPPAAYVFCPTTYVFHHHVHTHVIREKHQVAKAVSATAPYRPAKPVAGGGGGPGRKPQSTGGGKQGYKPVSPSLKEAGVSPRSAPKARIRPDARAIAYSKKPAARATAPSRESRGAFHADAPPRGGSRAFRGVPKADARARQPAVRAPGHGRPAPLARPAPDADAFRSPHGLRGPAPRIHTAPPPRAHPMPRAGAPSIRIDRAPAPGRSSTTKRSNAPSPSPSLRAPSPRVSPAPQPAPAPRISPGSMGGRGRR